MKIPARVLRNLLRYLDFIIYKYYIYITIQLRLYFDQRWCAKSTFGVQSSVPDRPMPRVPGVPAGTPRREERGGGGYTPFARGVGGRASRVINIPIQILSER